MCLRSEVNKQSNKYITPPNHSGFVFKHTVMVHAFMNPFVFILLWSSQDMGTNALVEEQGYFFTLQIHKQSAPALFSYPADIR